MVLCASAVPSGDDESTVTLRVVYRGGPYSLLRVDFCLCTQVHIVQTIEEDLSLSHGHALLRHLGLGLQERRSGPAAEAIARALFL